MSHANSLMIQLLARLKPGKCGVSDHAISLAEGLYRGFGVKTAFVVLNSAETFDVPFPQIHCDPSQLLEACSALSKSDPASILLHYSGYGFSADGAPLSLPRALERVRTSGHYRVGVYFHELFATSMPWKSAFWYTNRQKHVAKALAAQADFIATNLSRHSDWLVNNALRGSVTPLQLMPVFSSVGEISELPAMQTRRRVMAVFGLPGTRRNSYSKLRLLGSMLKTLEIEEILDVGPEFDAPSQLGGIPVKQMGLLSAIDLAGLLSDSTFGFVPYPSYCLAKSSVFAGLCANGTIPVVADSFSGQVDGLQDGLHVLSPGTAKSALAAGLDRSSAADWHWYMGHRIHVHAETYTRLLIRPGSDSKGCS